MIQYLLDTRQRRPITLFYSNKTYDDVVYQDVLDRAYRELGIKTIYAVTDRHSIPPSWNSRVGRISPKTIVKEVPDYQDCLFYISGPNKMVNSYKTLLREMGVRPDHIRVDFFPGFA